MSRAPFQVLVIPYRVKLDQEIEYCLFKRNDPGEEYWQGIAGGGEADEQPIDAARREAFEEGGVPSTSTYIQLDSLSMLPVEHVSSYLWSQRNSLMIPEYCFGVEVSNLEVHLSAEHSEYKWTDYEEALILLKWDSNKNALWELNYRLRNLIK